MEEIIDIKNPKDVMKYLEDVDDGDYLEIYFGRVHVEGEMMGYNDGLLRLIHNKYGIIEIDIEEILDDLLELAHTKKGKRTILRFY